MRKKIINQKRDALKQLPPSELIDRILDFKHPKLLDYTESGEPRKFPIRRMAMAIQDNAYQMTDNQYYTLIHHFSEVAVPEVKVVGTTFHKADVETLAKQPLSTDGRKSVYQMDFLLRPEPDNPKDKNAVMVLAHAESGSLVHIGYLPREFVSKHTFTESMETLGTLTDHSNGHFTNVSYKMEVDIDELGHMAAPDIHNTRFVYEERFSYQGFMPHPKQAAQYINNLHLEKQLNGDLENYGCGQKVIAMEYSFDLNHHGSVRVEFDSLPQGGTLSPLTIANSFIRFQHESILASRLVEHGYLQDVPINKQLLSADGSLNKVQVDPNPSVYKYQTEFKLAYPVNDLDAAQAYLSEDDMTKYLKTDLSRKYNTSDLADAILDIRWELTDDQSGTITLETNRAITPEESTVISSWIQGQNADGIGEGFEQQPFAEYVVSEGYELEEYDEETDMCSFDWESNPYTLIEITDQSRKIEIETNAEEFKKGIESIAPDIAERTDLKLTEADLDFARQMDLSDFGIM